MSLPDLKIMSLSQRLKTLQMTQSKQKLSFDHLSMEALEESIVDFGNTHKGRSFLEMWNDHQDWILWFTQHYENSAKPSHQKMVHFIKLKLERAEMEGEHVPNVPKLNLKTKAKAKSKAYPPPNLPEEPEIEDVESFEVLSQAESAYPMTHLEQRMLHMEDALTRIMNHLENAQGQHPPAQ